MFAEITGLILTATAVSIGSIESTSNSTLYTGDPTIDLVINLAISVGSYILVMLLKWLVAKVKNKIKSDKDLTQDQIDEIIKEPTKKTNATNTSYKKVSSSAVQKRVITARVPLEERIKVHNGK